MALVQYSENGFFAPRTIADAFRTTSNEVGRTPGLGKDAVQHKQRVRSDKTIADVVHKVSRASVQAFARSPALPLRIESCGSAI
ncbi:hypothetical protein NKH99_25930 [Mesorhizobium sp. M0854]|uniref:hypothetical protein n=1 Tax=Mesorhizobium sp. M0854 TaxID=2957013 RepID=UPI003338DE2F